MLAVVSAVNTRVLPSRVWTTHHVVTLALKQRSLFGTACKVRGASWVWEPIGPQGSCTVLSPQQGYAASPLHSTAQCVDRARKSACRKNWCKPGHALKWWYWYTQKATWAKLVSKAAGPEHITEMGNQGNQTLRGRKQQLRWSWYFSFNPCAESDRRESASNIVLSLAYSRHIL